MAGDAAGGNAGGSWGAARGAEDGSGEHGCGCGVVNPRRGEGVVVMAMAVVDAAVGRFWISQLKAVRARGIGTRLKRFLGRGSRR